MSDFPTTVYSPRTKSNKVGVVYHPEIPTTLFSEDLSLLDAEVVAIETELESWLDQSLKTTDAPTFAYGTEITDGASFLQIDKYTLLNTVFAGIDLSVLNSNLGVVSVNNELLLYGDESLGSTNALIFGDVSSDNLFFFQYFAAFNAFQLISTDITGGPVPLDTFDFYCNTLLLEGNSPTWEFIDIDSRYNVYIELYGLDGHLSFDGATYYDFGNYLRISNMPTTDPADFTNTIWYDPTDGNRLKMGT